MSKLIHYINSRFKKDNNYNFTLSSRLHCTKECCHMTHNDSLFKHTDDADDK